MGADVLEAGGTHVVFDTSETVDPNLLLRLSGGPAQLTVTSPPYWNLKNYGHDRQIGREPYGNYLKRCAAVWERAADVTSDDAVLAVVVGNRRVNGRYVPLAFDLAVNAEPWGLWDLLIWNVPNALPQPGGYAHRLFDDKAEFVLLLTKGGVDTGYQFDKPRVPHRHADSRPGKLNPDGRCLGNIVRVPAYRPPNVRDMGYHQAAFPEELVALLIETYTEPGDVVYDPFAGSGTTLKVARAMGRRAVGVEVNDALKPLISRRINEPWSPPDWRDIDLIHSAGGQRTLGRRRPRPAAHGQMTLDVNTAPVR